MKHLFSSISFLLVLLSGFPALSNGSILKPQTIDSLTAATVDTTRLPVMQTIAYGARFGLGDRLYDPDAHPIFNPFYEVPTGPMLLSAELLLSFTSLSRIESFGFASKVRWVGENAGSSHFTFAAGLGFDVLVDKVDMCVPFNFGAILDLGQTAQLDLSALIQPVFYFGQRRSLYYGATVGIRILDPQ